MPSFFLFKKSASWYVHYIVGTEFFQQILSEGKELLEAAQITRLVTPFSLTVARVSRRDGFDRTDHNAIPRYRLHSSL